MKSFAGRWGLVLSLISLVIVTVILTAAVLTRGEKQEISSSAESEEADTVSAAAPVKDPEMLAVWVPAFSLNPAGQGEQVFKEKFDKILSAAKSRKMNTLVVQVRSFADAYYPSDLFPWSGNLSGEQGKDPGYDPLAYMVEHTHKEGLQFHAWVNPYRIRLNGVPETFSENNLYVKWQNDPEKADWCLMWEETGGIYLNPAVPEVREVIKAGIREITEQYDVDGVQFDDYFYPTESPEFDKTTYEAYCRSCGEDALSLLTWRQQNVSLLVHSVYEALHQAKPTAVFGISPQGNVENDERLGADVTLWCSQRGYVDYICPQLYYNFEHPLLPYDKAAKQWRSLVTCKDVKLYFGLGLYKASSDYDSGTWKHSDSILAQEVDAGRELGCDGFMFYSCEYMEKRETQNEIENVMAVL